MAQINNPWTFQVVKKIDAGKPTLNKHGRPVDKNGRTIYKPFNRNDGGPFRPTDALLITELKDTYTSAHTRGPCGRGDPLPEPLVMTTPNADYLPAVNLTHQVVIMRRDARWGPHDWTQWPQWYFEDCDHFPYIRRRPAKEDMSEHPLRRLWWNMSMHDFVEEPGCGLIGVGRLREEIANEFYELRQDIMKIVDSYDCASKDDLRRLRAAAAAMRHCTATLRWTPQTYPNVLNAVTAAQRYYLETQAVLDKVRIQEAYLADRKPRSVDFTFMGAVTDDENVLTDLFEKGIPVWFVRPGALIFPNTNIEQQQSVIDPHPSLGVVMDRWSQAPVFYSGPLSPRLYFETGKWRPGTIDLTRVRPEELPPTVDTSLPVNDNSLAAMIIAPVPAPLASQASASTKLSSSGGVPNLATRDAAPHKLRVNINFDRFKQSASPYSTTTTPAWALALQTVNADPLRKIAHSQRALFRGYAFPDPLIFLTSEGDRAKEMALAWLVIHAPWMTIFTRMEHHQYPLPNPQQWRAYLKGISLDYELLRCDLRKPKISQPTQPTKSMTHSARRQQKTQDAAKDIFSIQKPERHLLTSLLWNGRVVWTPQLKADLQPKDIRLVVWDSHEHNFRLEVFSLDQCIMAEQWMDPEQQGVREQKLRAVFFQEATLMATFPSHLKTIASTDPQDRCHFVEAFRLVLMDWPDESASALRALQFHKRIAGQDFWDFELMPGVEKLLYSLYCQTFFDYFGRAPTIPHTLPSM